MGLKIFTAIALLFTLIVLNGYTAESIVKGDINDDGKIGLDEAIFALQVVSGAKSQTIDIQTDKTSYTSTESIVFKFVLKDIYGNPIAEQPVKVYDPVNGQESIIQTNNIGYVEYIVGGTPENGFFVFGFQTPDGSIVSYGVVRSDNVPTDSDEVKFIQIGNTANMIARGSEITVGKVGKQEITDFDRLVGYSEDTLIETATSPGVIFTGLLCAGAGVLVIASVGGATPVAIVACAAFVETTKFSLAFNAGKNIANFSIDKMAQLNETQKIEYKDYVEKGSVVYSLGLGAISIANTPSGGNSVVSYKISSNTGSFANQHFEEFITTMADIIDSGSDTSKLINVSTTAKKIDDKTIVTTITGQNPQTGLYTIQCLSFQKNALHGNLVVDSKANIFGSGKSAPPGGGILPPVYNFQARANQILTFPKVTGATAYYAPGGTTCTPDGSCGDGNTFWTDISSTGGISGIIHKNMRCLFLVGMFASDSEPSDPAPERLDFTDTDNFEELYPKLNQTFFIGDGLTGSGSGNIQKFHVPSDATRLFLGFADGWDIHGSPGYYFDNDGQLIVTFILNE